MSNVVYHIPYTTHQRQVHTVTSNFKCLLTGMFRGVPKMHLHEPVNQLASYSTRGTGQVGLLKTAVEHSRSNTSVKNKKTQAIQTQLRVFYVTKWRFYYTPPPLVKLTFKTATLSRLAIPAHNSRPSSTREKHLEEAIPQEKTLSLKNATL